MVVDSLTLERLDYRRLLELVASRCQSEPGRVQALAWQPLSAPEEVLTTQRLISEIRHLEDTGRLFSLQPFADLAPQFRRVRPQEAVLPAADIRRVLPVLMNAKAVLSVVHSAEDIPELSGLGDRLHPLPELRRAIERSISMDGSILDTASEDLAQIRRRIRHTENRLRKKLEDFILRPEVALCLQESFVTNRSSRWVIPVRRDAQVRVPGIVHDLSNSGETAFIEPLETLPLGNELGELHAEERAEELRILQALSERLRLALDEVEETYHGLAVLDSLMGAARLAGDFSMKPPGISPEGGLVIREGRHPLLWQLMKKGPSGTAPVPLTLEMDGREVRTVVITGPNTGGKTVALKTVGLLCLMALSGFHVPAAEGTEIPWLTILAADIGDDQSMEASLSTFSGHMRRISEILGQAGPGSLVLLDELGSGTDPEEGGPLACAIVEETTALGGLLVVSTHLGAVKGFVHELPQAVNAAVQFDYRTLQPTYVLETGVPGRSHALEIAARYGVPASVVDNARGMLTGRGSRMDRLVGDLEKLRKSAARQLDKARQSRVQAERQSEEAREERVRLEKKKKEILRGAHEEAAEIVRRTRREMDVLLEGLPTRPEELPAGSKGTPPVHRLARKAADNTMRDLLSEAEKLKETDLVPVPMESLRTGRSYTVRSLNTRGILKSLDRKTGRCRVLTDTGMDLDVAVSELCEAGNEAVVAEVGGTVRVRAVEEGVEQASRELNLIGQRVDPALGQLDRFLNRALLAGYREVRIVHGIGSGILSRAVREFLDSFPGVSDWRPAERPEGGEGATIVALATT